MDNEQVLDRVQNALLRMEERVNERFDKMDKRFDSVDARFDGVDARLDKVESRLQSLEPKVDSIGRQLALNNELLGPFIHMEPSVGRRSNPARCPAS